MSYDLKSESDIKQYIHNLGIEYRFGCLSEKNPEVCQLLAEYLEVIKKDFEKAAKIYKTNCDDYKYGKSCLKYGSYSLLGKGMKKSDYEVAYKYYEKGCVLDQPESCFNQGLLLVTNNEQYGVKQDVLKGMTLLEKACGAENATACYYLSGVHMTGMKIKTDNEQNDIPKNMQKAFQFALQACTLGNKFSCANLSQMYTKGDGVEKNAELAKKYKAMAVELDKEETSNQTLKFGLGLDD